MPRENVAPSVPAGATEQGSTFRERKMQQLATESGQAQQTPPQAEDLDDGTPSPGDGSAEDVEHEVAGDGLYADDDEQDADDDGEDLDDGTPSDDQEAAESDEESTWEKRYKDLQAAYTELSENREGMEREHAESMAQHLELRFELEDKLQEAVQRAQFLYNTMSGNAQRFKNINWSQVPPDKVQEVQAQAQQAMMMEQQAAQAFDQVRQQAEETERLVKQREAAIAKTRLRRTIPGWSNETYKDLREFAVTAGMAPQAFNEITNPVIIEWAYAAKQLADAGRKGSQRRTTKRKAKVPTNRQPRQQVRNDRGQFAKKQTIPNQRGSFADKHKHRLAMERRGGR